MQDINLEINSDKNYPDIYSVKINGLEIAEYISELNLNIKACEPAELTIKANVEHVALNSRALWDFPEPYKSYIEAKFKKTP